MLAYPFCNQTNLPLGLLIISASGRDIAVAMPSTLELAMASAKERWSIPNDLIFRLAVKKKDAPSFLANTAQGDIIILGDDAVYQIIRAGKNVLRVEIQVYGVKSATEACEKSKGKAVQPPPPPPEPVPVCLYNKNKKIRITIENSKGKLFRLNTNALPDVNLDWSQSQGGQSIKGNFLGQLTIKSQTDQEGRIVFSGKEMPSGLNFSAFSSDEESIKMVQLRTRSAKPFIQIFSPIEQFLTLELTLSSSWKFNTSWPACEVKSINEGKELVGYFLRVGPGVIEDVTTGSNVSGITWEAIPEPGAPRLSPDDKTPFDPSNPDLVDYNGVLLSAKDFLPRLDKVLGEQFQIDTLVKTNFLADITPHIMRHKNIAFRFLPQDFYEPAATLAIRPTPEITGRIFLLWQGVNDTNNWKKSKKRDNMPINWPDVIGCKDKSDELKKSDLFRCVELGWMEVIP